MSHKNHTFLRRSESEIWLFHKHIIVLLDIPSPSPHRDGSVTLIAGTENRRDYAKVKALHRRIIEHAHLISSRLIFAIHFRNLEKHPTPKITRVVFYL